MLVRCLSSDSGLYILQLKNTITFNGNKTRTELLRQNSKSVANHLKISRQKLLK